MKDWNETEVSYIQERACDRITEILDALSIQYIERNDYLQSACPCHNGDNDRSMYWATRTNHWKCMTRGCHKDRISGCSTSVFGLIRGAMSNKLNKPFYFNNAVMFAAKILGLYDLKLNKKSLEEREIDRIIKQYKKKKIIKPDPNAILLSDIVLKLKPDSVYYPGRGVTQEIIDKYHISYCGDRTKPFYERAFFPVMDPTGKFIIGFSGRSTWDKCEKCRCHHNPELSCPAKDRRKYYTKWKHSNGFNCEKYLYNYWYAKYHISKAGTAIICEGPGNCWAMEMAGINNSVAIMGSSMSKIQRSLLQKAGALTLILILDNDKAGEKATEKLVEELNYYFRIIPITPKNVNDVAEMNKNEIINKIGSVLKNESREDILKDN